MFAIEECIRTAQRGGVGVVVYFRKEGRALGEVTKSAHLSCVLLFHVSHSGWELASRDRYLVYNLRKRGGDSADKYFKSTELIAGVKDMRFQALMPDVLHWLGITKIDNMVSMSDMYDPSTTLSVAYILTPVPSTQETRCNRWFRHPDCQAIRPPRCASPLKPQDYADVYVLDHLIPMDSRVEIDAKIAAGYFTTGKQVKEEDLSRTVGRAWEEADH